MGYPTANPPLASAISGNNRDILIGMEDGRILCLDRNGTLRWTATMDAPIISLVTSRDGSTIVATGESNYLFSKTYNESLSPHYLFALRENGTLLWNYQTRGWNAAAVSDDGSVTAAIEKVSGTLRSSIGRGLSPWSRCIPAGLSLLPLRATAALSLPGLRKAMCTVYGAPSRNMTLPGQMGSRELRSQVLMTP